ncbi:MAG: WxcM-like domain-containing protein [Vogesella sp.]|nr:WxcM-like domain-containing protein [Vogesella sp.]
MVGVVEDAWIVTLGQNVTLSEDAAMRPAKIADGVTIGPRSRIAANLSIGVDAYIAADADVTTSVPAGGIVAGSPAVLIGMRAPLYCHDVVDWQGGVKPLPVAGVTLVLLPQVSDVRGSLVVGEFGVHVPFAVSRYFMVFGVPDGAVRGGHAHYRCSQFLLCVRGQCSVIVDDGQQRVEVLLDTPQLGLYLPPMTWGIQYRYSHDAVLLVFASHAYDTGDYIRDYHSFLALRRDSHKV